MQTRAYISLKIHAIFASSEQSKKKEENLVDKMRSGSLFVLQNDDDADDEHHLSNEICSSKADLCDRKGKIQRRK